MSAEVIIGWMHNGWVTGDFCRSLFNTLNHDRLGDWTIAGHIPLRAGVNLSTPRNTVVRTFLESDASHLWLLDADMSWEADALPKLLEADADVVSGLTFGQRFHREGGLSFFTTMFRETPDGLERVESYPEDTVIDVDLCGAACLLVKREVLEKLQVAYEEPWPWFAELQVETPDGDRGTHSEDITFTHRVREQGYEVKVHTGVKLGHQKTHEVTEATYLTWRDNGE